MKTGWIIWVRWYHFSSGGKSFSWHLYPRTNLKHPTWVDGKMKFVRGPFAVYDNERDALDEVTGIVRRQATETIKLVQQIKVRKITY